MGLYIVVPCDVEFHEFVTFSHSLKGQSQFYEAWAEFQSRNLTIPDKRRGSKDPPTAIPFD